MLHTGKRRHVLRKSGPQLAGALLCALALMIALAGSASAAFAKTQAPGPQPSAEAVHQPADKQPAPGASVNVQEPVPPPTMDEIIGILKAEAERIEGQIRKEEQERYAAVVQPMAAACQYQDKFSATMRHVDGQQLAGSFWEASQAYIGGGTAAQALNELKRLRPQVEGWKRQLSGYDAQTADLRAEYNQTEVVWRNARIAAAALGRSDGGESAGQLRARYEARSSRTRLHLHRPSTRSSEAACPPTEIVTPIPSSGPLAGTQRGLTRSDLRAGGFRRGKLARFSLIRPSIPAKAFAGVRGYHVCTPATVPFPPPRVRAHAVSLSGIRIPQVAPGPTYISSTERDKWYAR